MTDFNEVRVIGRVVRDAKLEVKGDVKYSIFSLAVNKDAKNENGEYEEKTIFMDFAIFNHYAEIMYVYLKQGTLIHVSGALKTRTWSKDDFKHTELSVDVKKIQLLHSSLKNSNAKSENTERTSSLVNDSPVFENTEPEESELTGIF